MSINMLSHGVSPSWIAAPMSVDSSRGLSIGNATLPQGEVGSGLERDPQGGIVPARTMRFDPAEPLRNKVSSQRTSAAWNPSLAHRTATSRLASSIKARMAVSAPPRRSRLQQGGDAGDKSLGGTRVPLAFPSAASAISSTDVPTTASWATSDLERLEQCLASTFVVVVSEMSPPPATPPEHPQALPQHHDGRP